VSIRPPFTAKKGHLHLVCFYEDRDLLFLFPVPGFTVLERFPTNPILAGDIIQCPEGYRKVIQVEVIPALDIEKLEEDMKNEMRKVSVVFNNRVIAGYKYKLANIWDSLSKEFF